MEDEKKNQAEAIEKKEMGETERMFWESNQDSFPPGQENKVPQNLETPEKTETKASFIPPDFSDFDFEKLLWGGTDMSNIPTVNFGDEFVITEGDSLENPEEIVKADQVIEAIRSVEDPEIMVNVFDLGLIYRMDILKNADIEIDMTVTAPSCPVAGLMPKQVAEAVSKLANTGKVTVKLVWEPIWTPDRMNENARYLLDMF